MNLNLLYSLKKVLPDLDVTNVTSYKIIQSGLPDENQATKILAAFFQEKTKKSQCHQHPSDHTIQSETKRISKLFPSINVKYIYEMLQNFRDLPNRKEIVLRLIVNSKNPELMNLKRSASTDYLLDNVSHNKIRKMSTPVSSTVTSQSLHRCHSLNFSESPLEQAEDSVTSTITIDSLKPTTVTSSNSEDVVESTETILEPFTIPINNSYEIPDIMEHFDLPVLDLQIPVAENCTVTSQDQEELPIATIVEPDIAMLPQSTNNVHVDLSADDGSSGSDVTITQITPLNLIQEKRDDSQKVDSQDSNNTEVYELNDEVNEEVEENHYTVSLVGPTSIKIKSIGEMEKDPSPRKEVRVEPFNDTPSTSTQEQNTMETDNTKFDLIEYLREITNAPPAIIEKYCNKIKWRRDMRPGPTVLNHLVDVILTNPIESEDSDVEFDPQNSNLGIYNGVVNEILPETKADTNGDTSVDQSLVNSLCTIFPDACPNYIRLICANKIMNNVVLDDLISVILSANNQYPKRPVREPEPEVVPENQLEILKELLPDADPDYLSMMCDKFEGKAEQVKAFINQAMERRDYPTMKDYQRRQQLSAQQKQYTSDFTVENFVKVIPDPHNFFSDPTRQIKLSSADSHYALVFMRNKFNKLPIRIIQSVFTKQGCHISNTIKQLEDVMKQEKACMKSVRKTIAMPSNVENIPLLQELAYHTHQQEINEYLKHKKESDDRARQIAKDSGLLKTCTCCFDEEVLPEDIHLCEKECQFCKSCIVKSTEVRFGEGKLDFPCLNCDSSFTLQTLQAVLSPKLFNKIAQKKALEEIKAAGIDELEFCPFCDFATIPAEGYNIFTCMNPECMKESCRSCKEPSHIPLRCDEIEKDADVRARTFVENKMTEALLRKCWKCGIKFFKEEGCNKMTCSCGAHMCYICGKPVDSYKHFNGNGGDRLDLCPLYSDTNILNKENVLKGAKAAKAEIGNVPLKHDPTTDVNQHFQERRRMFPQDHLLIGHRQPLDALQHLHVRVQERQAELIRVMERFNMPGRQAELDRMLDRLNQLRTNRR